MRPNFFITEINEEGIKTTTKKLRYPEMALFCLSSKNKFRQKCVILINNP